MSDTTSGDKRAAENAAPGDRLSVLIVTDVYPPDCGGSGWSTDALVRTLLDRGHIVEVVELDDDVAGERTREYDDVAVRTLGLRDARTRRARLGAREFSHAPVRDWVAARLALSPEIDVVHAQHLHSGPGALQAARAAGRAGVITLRDHWPVCLHGLTWWGGRECPGCTPRNLVGCMNEYYGLSRPVAAAMIPWARRRLRARGEVPGSAHRAIVPSKTLATRLEARLGSLPISVVPNIVDPERSAALAESGLDPSGLEGELPDRYLLAAGKLNAGKGFDTLLETLHEAGVTGPLVIAGEGPLRGHLERQAASAGIALHMTGWVDAPRLLALMRGARALLLPSRVEEALARTMLESFSVGTPVISWPVGSSREVIEAGVNGWIVETADDLHSALEVLDRDPQRLRSGALETALTRFAPAAVYPAILDVYRAAMAEAER